MFLSKQGIDHAFERHVIGENVDSKPKTSFYPTGNTIRNPNIDSPAKLPDTMSLSNRQLRNEIKDFAYRTIRNDNSDGGSATYDGVSRNGIDEITINVDGSQIESVYPTKGSSVRRWNNDEGEWQKWDGSGWIEWNDYSP
jgi:hypothetical protein